jgi:hypothetical protein
MIKFIRDCFAFLLLGMILLGFYLVACAAGARGGDFPSGPAHRRAFVALSVATFAGNIADVEVTAWKLRRDPYFCEHNPLYGKYPSQARLLAFEISGATVAVLLARELRRHGHARLALAPLAMTTASSAFWVQHNLRWKSLRQ